MQDGRVQAWTLVHIYVFECISLISKLFTAVFHIS